MEIDQILGRSSLDERDRFHGFKVFEGSHGQTPPWPPFDVKSEETGAHKEDKKEGKLQLIRAEEEDAGIFLHKCDVNCLENFLQLENECFADERLRSEKIEIDGQSMMQVVINGRAARKIVFPRQDAARYDSGEVSIQQRA